jgi:hypothetical protein
LITYFIGGKYIAFLRASRAKMLEIIQKTDVGCHNIWIADLYAWGSLVTAC